MADYDCACIGHRHDVSRYVPTQSVRLNHHLCDRRASGIVECSYSHIRIMQRSSFRYVATRQLASRGIAYRIDEDTH